MTTALEINNIQSPVLSEYDEDDNVFLTSVDPQSPIADVEVGGDMESTSSSAFAETPVSELLGRYAKVVKETDNPNILSYNPYRPYKVGSTNLADFYVGYSQFVYNNSCVDVNISERIKDIHPFVLTVTDLHHDESTYIQEIQKVIDDKFDGKELQYCVTTSSTTYVDSFRIQFPNLVLAKNNAAGLFDEIKLRLKQVPYLEQQDWNRVLTLENTASSDIALYGSCRSLEDAPHSTANFYSYDSKKALITIFNIANCDFLRGSSLAKKLEPEILIPVLLSRHYNKREVLPKSAINHREAEVRSFSDDNVDSKVNTFLDMIPARHLAKEIEWVALGHILGDIYADNRSKAVQKFTAITNKHASATLNESWAKYNNDRKYKLTKDQYIAHVIESKPRTHYSVKSLAWIAKESSNREYKDWHSNWLNNQLENSINCTPTDIAELIYRNYWLELAYDENNNKWLCYLTFNISREKPGGHTKLKWNIVSEITITEIITNNFVPKLIALSNHYEALAGVTGITQKVQSERKNMVKVINTIINKLSGSAKATIIKELKYKANVAGIASWLDTNPNTLGMPNGDVMQLITIRGKLSSYVIRRGRPEDYVRRSMGVEYKAGLNEDSYQVRMAREFLEKVYPDEDIRKLVVTLFASRFRGENAEKWVPAMTGRGDAGKSTMENILIRMFGDTNGYAGCPPTTLITSKGKAGSANPELADIIPCRIVFLNEMSETTEIDASQLKGLSGNDRIWARFLYDNGGMQKPLFMAFIVSNTIPAIRYAGSAEQNRLIVIPHDSIFSDDIAVAMKTEEQQFADRIFKKDKFITEDLQILAEGMIWIFVNEGLPLYIKEGIKVPEIIKIRTRDYWDEKDIFRMFFNHCMSFVNDNTTGKPSKTDVVLVSSAFDLFNDWYQRWFPGTPVPPGNLFTKYLGIVIGQQEVTDKFYGVRIVEDRAYGGS